MRIFGLKREVKISRSVDIIWPAILQRDVKISGSGENIWLAVLRRYVRISKPGEDIWLARVCFSLNHADTYQREWGGGGV